MPMGNPLSPTIANIVLDDLLDETINKLNKTNTKIKFIVKYVDDVFAIIKKQDQILIMNTLNEYHKKIQFTVEIETNKTLPYLDTKLHRTGNKIIMDWYAKTMASGRMINFFSTQPMKYKINSARNLINKIIDISDPQFHTKNIQTIKTILKKNNFPNRIIDELINNKTNLKQKNQLKINSEKDASGNAFHSAVYIPGLTDNKNLHAILNINKKENERGKIIFAHRSNSTLRNIFTNTKPPKPKTEQHNVVYEIPCKGTNDEKCAMIYIGTTKRLLSTRLTEHQADIRNKRTSTALAQHIMDNGHTADFDNVRILDKEKRENTRYTLESLRIQQRIERTMNTKEDKDKLCTIYTNVIK